MQPELDHKAARVADDSQPDLSQLFFVHHVEYPPGGLSPRELQHLRELVSNLKQAAAPHSESLEFAFPGNINPETWKSVAQQHCYGWRWTTGLAFRQEKLSSSPPRATPMKRYFSSLAKAFPEQAQKLELALKASEAPRPDPVQLLTKTSSFEQLFRGRRWISPTEALLGTGGLALFCVRDSEHFFSHAALITGQAESVGARGAQFLIPVFTRESFAAATRHALYSWFSLFDLYLLEYRYGEGLLIASRHDLTPIVDSFHARLEAIPPDSL